MIADLVSVAMIQRHPEKIFVPGESAIPVTGKVYGQEELMAAVQASLGFWLTSGPYSEQFESLQFEDYQQLQRYLQNL